MAQSAAQTARPWTTGELEQLRRLAPLGAEAVAAELGRSVYSVRHQAARQRISLRRPGERRGRPMPSAADGGPVELCPWCAVEPVEHVRGDGAGLCRSCRLRWLAARHDRAAAEIEHRRAEAQRELDAARQRKHRVERERTDRAARPLVPASS